MGLIPEWGRSLDEEFQPTPVFLPGESHGQKSLTGNSPWGHRQSGTTMRASTDTCRYRYRHVGMGTYMCVYASCVHTNICDQLSFCFLGKSVTNENLRLITFYIYILHYNFKGSVKFSCSVVSNSLLSHGLQHTRPPYPSPTPRVYPNSCLLSR